MDTIVKVFVGIYLILMTIFVSMGIISANLDTRNAQEFASYCEATIKNANYSSETVDLLTTEAEEHGYELYFESHAGSNSRATSGYLTIKYSFELPIFSIKQYHKINKYV